MSNFFDPTAEPLTDKIPTDESADVLSTFFKVFGDGTRIKILFLLLEKELCVNDIALILQMNQPAVSHQLRILRQNKIVKYRKEGKLSYYSLDDEHVSNILMQGNEHVSHKNMVNGN